jgi:RNA polymerase sigma-70 factor (ECF subfamily)
LNEQPLAQLSEADARALAFRHLADQHLDASYRLAYVILRDQHEAQDATHDAFVTAWRKWSTLRDPAAFQRWFDRILVNTCRHRLRDRARHRTSDLTPELVATPDAHAQVEARDLIGDAIGALSADHRIVLALRYASDLTVEQIAEHLGVRAGTVKSRLHYALRRMQDAVAAGDQPEAGR